MVWRLPTAIRVLVYAGGVALTLLGVFAVVESPANPLAWSLGVVLAVVALVNARLARRSCAVDGVAITATGRFARRRVELADLRQVGVGIGGAVWVQAHHPLDDRGGTVLSLRMIPNTTMSMRGGPAAEQAAELIRTRAVAAGATLDPTLPDRKLAPSRKPLIFSI